MAFHCVCLGQEETKKVCVLSLVYGRQNAGSSPVLKLKCLHMSYHAWLQIKQSCLYRFNESNVHQRLPTQMTEVCMHC